MDIYDYIALYKNTSFKELSFNEVDALILSLISYVPFDELNKEKSSFKNEELKSLIKSFDKNNVSNRKKMYLRLALDFLEAPRYKEAKFMFFKKIRDEESIKQFQAITIVFKNFAYISFCGTDATMLGWKEDLNMSYLETVPSEIEASKYANFIRNRYPFKRLYLGGHSKGGRLAITASKNLTKTKRVAAIFSFDGPNYPSSFYDEKYNSIESKILSYNPNESIIGRLMINRKKEKIISSSTKLLMQHDAFSWLVDNFSFIYLDNYSERSTRIVNTINHSLTTFDEENKKAFIDVVFDFLYRLDAKNILDEKGLLIVIKDLLAKVWKVWKNTSKEDKAIIKKIIFGIGKDYLLNSK